MSEAMLTDGWVCLGSPAASMLTDGWICLSIEEIEGLLGDDIAGYVSRVLALSGILSSANHSTGSFSDDTLVATMSTAVGTAGIFTTSPIITGAISSGISKSTGLKMSQGAHLQGSISIKSKVAGSIGIGENSRVANVSKNLTFAGLFSRDREVLGNIT